MDSAIRARQPGLATIWLIFSSLVIASHDVAMLGSNQLALHQLEASNSPEFSDIKATTGKVAFLSFVLKYLQNSTFLGVVIISENSGKCGTRVFTVVFQLTPKRESQDLPQ